MTREEAIEELLRVKHIFLVKSDADKALDMAIEALKEQKTGKWEIYEGLFDYDWECSECGCSSYEKTDWCAHCGARMVGEEE